MEKLHPDFVLCMTDEVLVRPKVQEFLRVFQLNESTTQNAFIRAVMRLYFESVTVDARVNALIGFYTQYPWIQNATFANTTALKFFEDVVSDLLDSTIGA